MPHKNRGIFLDLMNKAPFNRICEKHSINIGTVYRKLDFIHQQCQAFVADRERRLADGLEIPRLYLATDRQDYAINWSFRNDKRNVVLHAAGSADQSTGYVFGMHLNFDYGLDPVAVEAVRLAGSRSQEAVESATAAVLERLGVPSNASSSCPSSRCASSSGRAGTP